MAENGFIRFRRFFRLFAIHKKGAIRKTVPRLLVANSV
jgi:hypothetical protein